MVLSTAATRYFSYSLFLFLASSVTRYIYYSLLLLVAPSINRNMCYSLHILRAVYFTRYFCYSLHMLLLLLLYVSSVFLYFCYSLRSLIDPRSTRYFYLYYFRESLLALLSTLWSVISGHSHRLHSPNNRLLYALISCFACLCVKVFYVLVCIVNYSL